MLQIEESRTSVNDFKMKYRCGKLVARKLEFVDAKDTDPELPLG